MNTNTRISGSEDNHSDQPDPTPHIAHDAAVRAKRRDEAEKLALRIKSFVADRGLTEEQVEDLRNFVRQQIIGRVIADERLAVYSGISRTLHWPARLMKIMADTIPPLCQETVRLALSASECTLGFRSVVCSVPRSAFLR